MKKLMIIIAALAMVYSNAHAYTNKQEETIAQLIIVSSTAVAICNEKELPNLDYRGSMNILMSLLAKYPGILQRLNPLYVKAVEEKFRSMSTEEKYKFCMDLYKTAPELFEDRESGESLGGNK